MNFFDIVALSSPLMLLAMIVSVLFGVVFFITSKVLIDPAMENKGKQFLFSTLETILILMAFLLIATVIQLVFSAVMGCAGNCDIITFADIAMLRVQDLTIGLYMDLYLLDLLAGPFIQSMLTTPMITSGSGAMQLTFMPLMGLQVILETYYTLMQHIINIAITITARQSLLRIAPLLVAFALPFAVLLRALPGTKGVGSSLLAILLVVYFVFPLSTLFSDYLIFSQYKVIQTQEKLPASFFEKEIDPDEAKAEYEHYKTLEQTKPKSEQGSAKSYTAEEAAKRTSGGAMEILGKGWDFLLGSLIPIIWAIVDQVSSKGWAGIIKVFFQLWWVGMWFENLSPLEWQGRLMYSALSIMINIGQLAVPMLLSLLMELIISITMYRAFARLFGGDASMLGLSKVI